MCITHNMWEWQHTCMCIKVMCWHLISTLSSGAPAWQYVGTHSYYNMILCVSTTTTIVTTTTTHNMWLQSIVIESFPDIYGFAPEVTEVIFSHPAMSMRWAHAFCRIVGMSQGKHALSIFPSASLPRSLYLSLYVLLMQNRYTYYTYIYIYIYT